MSHTEIKSAPIADQMDLGLTLTIPASASLLPARARTVGGVARIHPYWSALSTDPGVADPCPNWGPGSIESVVPTSAVTFHRRSGSFQALSVKTGRTVSGIGPHELAQCEELEVDPFTVDYDLQGLQTSWKAGHSYTPDYHSLHAMRGLIAGEVKADGSYFSAPDYLPVMTNVERTFSALGIGFDKVSGTLLHAQTIRRRNVRRAYCNRFTAFADWQRDAVQDEIGRDEEVPMGKVYEILGNDPRLGEQIVHALLCRRVIAYDLDQPVTSATPVRAAPAPAADHDIRAIKVAEPA